MANRNPMGDIMRVLFILAATPFVLALLGAIVSPLLPKAHGAETWKEWGIAPYASSREEACKKAPEAIDGFNLPSEVKEHFKAALGTTCKGGVIAWLTPGMMLEEMWSGSDAHHKVPYVMKNVPVAELSVLKSPDNRTYRKGAVAETAKAFQWTFVYDGKTFMLNDPFVCDNWNWTFGPPPPPVPPPAIVLAPPPPPKALDPIAGGCPNVYHLKEYVYERKAITLPGVAQTAAKEEMEEHFVYGRRDPQHVSRTHYTQFQKALAAGELRHSTNAHTFRASFIMTPEATGGEPTITKEFGLGDITVKDTFYEISLTLEQIETWDAIRLVPIEDGHILSPPRYHMTGFHEMRFFFKLPNTKRGEWDSNPDPDCVMGAAWIEQ